MRGAIFKPRHRQPVLVLLYNKFKNFILFPKN